MRFSSPLVEGRLIRRYKRFFADVELADGRTVTAHVANSGRMTGLDMAGLRVFLTTNDDPKRTLKFALELVEVDDGRGATLVGINTARPNGIVAQAIAAGDIPALSGYADMRREVRYGVNSRIDLLLTGEGRPDTYVEVKNVHLVRRPGLAEFPDARTERGTKHLGELSAMARQGKRAVMLWFVHRADCERLSFARDVDPDYADAVAAARAAGVELHAVSARVSTEDVTVGPSIPVVV